MSENIASRLRSLAKEYSQGRLSLEEYRKVRTPLLDSLQGSPHCTDRRKPASPSAIPQAQHVPRSWVFWLGLAFLGALVVGALSSRLFRDRSDALDPPSESRRPAPASSDRIFQLVAPLLNDPDWTEARIAAVNASLLEEGSRQIAAHRGTEWFQRFAREVRRRLQEQKARDADRAVPERSSLAALAVTIGLDVKPPAD